MHAPMEHDGFRNITLQQMEALIRLVETGSFTHAAERMYLTQPTLTKHIHNLEDAIGARVVDRKNTGVSLTPEGRILYDYARRIARLREDAQEKIENLKSDESGHIFLCASTIPATYLIPRFLGLLNKSDPAIRVHIQTGDSEETIQAILGDQAEIGVAGKNSLDRRLKVEPLWNDRLVLAVPAGHPWVKRSHVSVGEIAGVPFVLRERGSGTRSALEECLAISGGQPLGSFNITCEMGSSEAVKEAILAGLGVSVLSIHAMERELAQGLLAAVPIEHCAIARRFYLIYRKQFRLMKHHRRFITSIKNYHI
jgi:DNA-binding transcriptional LysR family regulator